MAPATRCTLCLARDVHELGLTVHERAPARCGSRRELKRVLTPRTSEKCRHAQKYMKLGIIIGTTNTEARHKCALYPAFVDSIRIRKHAGKAE